MQGALPQCSRKQERGRKTLGGVSTACVRISLE